MDEPTYAPAVSLTPRYVETAISRYKKIIGRLMHSINMDNQKVEARLACKILNIMTGLGMPESERIG